MNVSTLSIPSVISGLGLTIEPESYLDEYHEEQNSFVKVLNKEEPADCGCATILVGVTDCKKRKVPKIHEIEFRIHIQHPSRPKKEGSLELERNQPGDVFLFKMTMTKAAARDGENLFDGIFAESQRKMKESCESKASDAEECRYFTYGDGVSIILMSASVSHS